MAGKEETPSDYFNLGERGQHDALATCLRLQKGTNHLSKLIRINSKPNHQLEVHQNVLRQQFDIEFQCVFAHASYFTMAQTRYV